MWEHHQSQVRDVPSVSGQPGTSQVVPDMVCEYHQSQVRDVPSVPGQPGISEVVPNMVWGASSVPGLRCPICPRTTWDIQGCSRHGVWEHHQSQVRDVPSVPGQPGTSEVVPNRVCGASSVPGLRCPICPRTTWDIRGCSQHGVWEHHQSQVRDVPSVSGQPGTSQVVPDMVCEYHQSQVRDVPSVPGQPGISEVVPNMVWGASSVPGLRCPICPRTTWDIQGCSRHGVWEHHQSQVRDVPSVPGQPGTSEVVPNRVCGASSVPGLRCPICPRTTWDIRGCSQHGVWEHHQSQVRDVPSVSGQPGTSQVVPDMVCEYHQSQVRDVPSVPGQPGISEVVPNMVWGASSVPGLRCPICPRTTWDIQGCSRHGVWEHHQSQVRDVPSVPGQPGTSEVVPNRVCEYHQSQVRDVPSVPGPRCPICPRTTWDIQGCSRHGVWEHHQSQVQDVPSVPGQPGISEVVPDMVCGSIISPRSEMSHLSQDNLGHPRLFPTWCVGASSVPGPRCPICPRTTWDIQGCSRHGVWEHHQSQVRDVPSISGCPGISEVVPNMVCEYHQSQVRDVPSISGCPGISEVVPNMVCGSIISPRSEMSLLSQDNLGHPRLFPTWCVSIISPRFEMSHLSQDNLGHPRLFPTWCVSIISPRSEMSHLSQVVLGYPRLFPTWCVGASSVPGPRCPICLRTTWDIQGCSRHGV